MDLPRVARSIRVIRVRKGMTQAEVATTSGVSRSFVSNVERARLRHVDLERLERVCRALEADLDVRVRWRGEAIDLLLDEAHATLVENLVRELRAARWETIVEATFADGRDRGSVDVLGWHVGSRVLLVAEVKSTIGDSQATLMVLDRKVRLARKIAETRGWSPVVIARLLAVADRSTNRHRIARVEVTFRTSFPDRGWAVRRWVRTPEGGLSGLLFLPDSTGSGARRHATGRQRVRQSSAR